jgi:pimeloyl-ACP methyl ester carboxylesterase
MALLPLAGCSLMLTEAIVSTPHRLNPLATTPLPIPARALGLRERFTVPIDGADRVELLVSVMDPSMAEEPRGTILVLHGIRAQSLWMHDIAEALTDEEYRVVLVDLRGHGGSTGETLTFGVEESRDLVQVIDELEARGLVAGKLGVFGHSFGATTAIHLAAIERRVATVVAVSPFADLRDEVPHYVRTMLPGLGHLASPEFYDRALDDAGRRGGFDPDEASAEIAAFDLTQPILLLHGQEDIVVPPSHSRRIYDHSPPGSALITLPGVGHFGAWLDASGRVKREAAAWFDGHLK